MTHWLFPANTKFYDVFSAFGKTETFWPMNAKVIEGDVIYLYLATPYKQIAFVCDVVATDISQESIIEKIRPFFKMDIGADKKPKPFIILRPKSSIKLNNDSPLGLKFLKDNGLNGMLMGPRKLDNNPPLLSYIQRVLS